MSALGDAMKAIKNVLLMQSDIERMQKEIAQVAGDVRGLRDYAVSIDLRVVRLEALEEARGPVRKAQQPRLEG
jgi:hypothetical protein